MSGGQLEDPGKSRRRRGNVTKRQIFIDRGEIRPSRHVGIAQNPLQLRREIKARPDLRIENRLLSDTIASQKQTVRRAIPYSKGKHAAKAAQAIGAPLPISVQDDFGVGAGTKSVT